jgi:hypothetical protein
MTVRTGNLHGRLEALDGLLGKLRAQATPARGTPIDRLRADAAALRFHLRPGDHPPVIVILGGTGTGKSTLVNRLLDSDVTATSFRRTYTAGPVAVAREDDAVPRGWMGLDPIVAGEKELPARGQSDALIVAPLENELTKNVTLVDTPDLDGDQPAHHAQADRAFRWAQAVLFLVTPEKYQMTELVPYYRLASRYSVPALYVMNKAEEPAVVSDYARVLGGATTDVKVFAIPRDDAAYQPPGEMRLEALRSAVSSINPATGEQRDRGAAARASDLMDRVRDQALAPLRGDRRDADRLIASLRAMETPAAGIDVNPLTRQLQRRLQQRSVLYLMGPGRILDRVRQVPGLLARLPRTTWDLLRGAPLSGGTDQDVPKDWDRRVPDFRAAVQDQFAVVQSRIDDALHATRTAETWMADHAAGYAASKLPAAAAGNIADEELASLKEWLEKRWNATPRDTAILNKMLKLLPGGEKLTRWSEAAPYLLAIVVATHHAFFGHVDLLILGGYSLATWLTERLSNEVAARTRLTNTRIAERFTQLAHEQIARTCDWLNKQAPPTKLLDELEQRANQIQETVGER